MIGALLGRTRLAASAADESRPNSEELRELKPGGLPPRLSGPYQEPPSGDPLERAIKEQTVVTDLVSKAGTGLSYALVTNVAYQVADRLVSGLLLPLTDQLFLLFVLMLAIALAAKAAREIFDGVAELLEPAAADGSRFRGRWLPIICAAIDFGYLVAFLAAVRIGLAMLEQLFPVSQAEPWTALFVGVFAALQVLLIVSLPACGLVAHGLGGARAGAR